MSAKEPAQRKRKSAKERKRAQKDAKERQRALPRKNCKQPGLKQARFKPSRFGNSQLDAEIASDCDCQCDFGALSPKSNLQERIGEQAR